MLHPVASDEILVAGNQFQQHRIAVIEDVLYKNPAKHHYAELILERGNSNPNCHSCPPQKDKALTGENMGPAGAYGIEHATSVIGPQAHQAPPAWTQRLRKDPEAGSSSRFAEPLSILFLFCHLLVIIAKAISAVWGNQILNLPEVKSAHEVLGVPTVSARFGTAPFFWNWAMLAVANLVPLDFLKERSKVQSLVELSYPIVQAVDKFAGELMSMRVDLECTDGRKAVGIYSHKKMSMSVGAATAAFVRAVLQGSTQPGVWFPEEPEGIAVEARKKLLEWASEGTINFVMNRPPWMVETDPKEIGFGLYMQ